MLVMDKDFYFSVFFISLDVYTKTIQTVLPYEANTIKHIIVLFIVSRFRESVGTLDLIRPSASVRLSQKL